MNTPDTAAPGSNTSGSDATPRTALEHELAQLIIDTLNLEHLTAAEIPAGQPLFGEGLGLDSVDALELALALQKQYAIHIESDVKHARQHFATIASLADFVQSQHKPCAD